MQSQAPGSHNTVTADGKLRQLQDDFVRNVSHELRTPLAILSGYAELLKEGELGALTQQQHQALQLISHQTAHLVKLVDRISMILSIRTHDELRMLVPLGQLAREVVESTQCSKDCSGVEFNFGIGHDPLTVIGDPYHIREAVASLVENAVKFTPKGGSISVSVYRCGDTVTFEVVDTGIGISEDKLVDLFESFYQVDGSTTRRYSGLGLGLTLAKDVAEAHGGYLEVESQPAVGSEFRLCFPLMPQYVNTVQESHRVTHTRSQPKSG